MIYKAEYNLNFFDYKNDNEEEAAKYNMKEALVREIIKNVGIKVERDNSVYPANTFIPMFKLKAKVEIYTREDIEEAIKMYVEGYNYYEIFGKLNGEHINK